MLDAIGSPLDTSNQNKDRQESDPAINSKPRVLPKLKIKTQQTLQNQAYENSVPLSEKVRQEAQNMNYKKSQKDPKLGEQNGPNESYPIFDSQSQLFDENERQKHELYQAIKNLNLSEKEVQDLKKQGFGDVLFKIEQEKFQASNQVQQSPSSPQPLSPSNNIPQLSGQGAPLQPLQEQQQTSPPGLLMKTADLYGTKKNVKSLEKGIGKMLKGGQQRSQSSLNNKNQVSIAELTTLKSPVKKVIEDQAQKELQDQAILENSKKQQYKFGVPLVMHTPEMERNQKQKEQEIKEMIERKKEEARKRREDMSKMFEKQLDVKVSQDTNPFVWQNALRSPEKINKQNIKEIPFQKQRQNMNHINKKRSHWLQVEKQKERDQVLAQINELNIKEKKDEIEERRKQGELVYSDEESVKSAHRPLSGNNFKKPEFQEFNQKFHEGRETKAQELVIKDISHEIQNDKILALLQIHDTFVGEEPKVGLHVSKWGVLKKNSDVAVATGMTSPLHVISGALLQYQSQLKIQSKVKGNSQFFDQYIDKREKAVEDMFKKTEKALKYYDVYKKAHTSISEEQHKHDPTYQYFKEVARDTDLFLPVLEHVYRKTLCLEGYTLSIGHCRALAKAFEYFDQFINRIIFDNCGIDDQEFAAILRGCLKLKDFKKIIYKRNVFFNQSLKEMEEFLMRRIPNHLEVLKIENCKMEPTVSQQLLEIIYKKNQLRSLGLVDFSITEESFEILTSIVEESYHLRELDLSWNQIKPHSFSQLLSVLSYNQHLMYLNLSWNQLMEDDPVPVEEEEIVKQEKYERVFKVVGGWDFEELPKEERKPYLAMGKKYPEYGDFSAYGKEKDTFEYTVFDDEKDQTAEFNQELSQTAKQAIENLCNFIKRNRMLQHADFSHTGLCEQQLWYFGRALRRSKSIKSLHLSGNPGITDRLKKYLSERAHCMPQEEENIIDITQLPSQIEVRQTRHENNQRAQNLSTGESDIQSNKKTLSSIGKKLKKDNQQKAAFERRQREVQLIKKLTFQKRNEQVIHTQIAVEKEILIFTRQTGHKVDIPGSGQWKMITHQEPGDHACWVCDKQNYSLIFWNELIGASQAHFISLKDRDFIIKKVKNINKDLDTSDIDKAILKKELQNEEAKIGVPQVDTEFPMIYGEFTNWKEKRMFEIREFCEMIDQHKPDIYELCKAQGHFHDASESLDDLAHLELQLYQQEIQHFYDSYRENWKDVVYDFLPYKQSNLVNAELRGLLDNKTVPLYVFPCFMKSSKRYYVVKQTKYKKPKDQPKANPNPDANSQIHVYSSIEDTNSSKEGSKSPFKIPQSNLTDRGFDRSKENGLMNIMIGEDKQHQATEIRAHEGGMEKLEVPIKERKQKTEGKDHYYVHSTIADFRREEIPEYRKLFGIKTVVRVFRKETSIFAPWKIDDSYIINKCVDIDSQNWKLEKVVKDPSDQQNIIEYYRQNFDKFNQNYIFLSGKGATVPWVNLNAFTEFARACKFMDKNVPTSTIDRLFIAANVTKIGAKQIDNPDKELARYEFFECLVRIANEKFKRFGDAQSSTEALEMLMDNHVLPFGPYLERMHTWREKVLWTLDVNDVFHSNNDALQDIYNKLVIPPNQILSKEPIWDLFCKNKDELMMSDKEVSISFTACKMTVVDEIDNGKKKYDRIKFVEFLEFLARLSQEKFSGSEQEEIPLAEKLEHVLTDLLEHFGHKLKKVHVEIHDETESDSDY